MLFGIKILIAVFVLAALSQLTMLVFMPSGGPVEILIAAVSTWMAYGFYKGISAARIIALYGALLLAAAALFMLGVYLWHPEFRSQIPDENIMPMMAEAIVRVIPLVLVALYVGKKNVIRYFAEEPQ